jgi:hypothetical protein
MLFHLPSLNCDCGRPALNATIRLLDERGEAMVDRALLRDFKRNLRPGSLLARRDCECGISTIIVALDETDDALASPGATREDGA